MFTMGDDFNYENAQHYFKNMDKLIKHMNDVTNETNINVFYSTPSCYSLALNENGGGTGGTEWQTKSDDFFPYCDGGGGHTKYYILVQTFRIQSFICCNFQAPAIIGLGTFPPAQVSSTTNASPTPFCNPPSK